MQPIINDAASSERQARSNSNTDLVLFRNPGPPPAPLLPRDLASLVHDELDQPVLPEVTAMATAIARRHSGARAVLFYGSCLRETQLEGRMLDFYLIVDDYGQAFERSWLAAANRLLPPNVFPVRHADLMGKYAVLSEADFARLASAATRSVSVWARFAQPSRLVWAADDFAAERAAAAVVGAAPALLAAVRHCLPDRVHILDLWSQAFQLTYAAELRPERADRGSAVVKADAERYKAFTQPALQSAGLLALVTGDDVVFTNAISSTAARAARRDWARRSRGGKMLNIARLMKASFTYAGGLDYLAWKVARHTGVQPDIRPWQRRWPIFGALYHLPRLIMKGAVR